LVQLFSPYQFWGGKDAFQFGVAPDVTYSNIVPADPSNPGFSGGNGGGPNTFGDFKNSLDNVGSGSSSPQQGNSLGFTVTGQGLTIASLLESDHKNYLFAAHVICLADDCGDDTLTGFIGGGPVISAVPIPAGISLLGGGLAALGLIGWRKRAAIKAA
jgi:hypothetical protein